MKLSTLLYYGILAVSGLASGILYYCHFLITLADINGTTTVFPVETTISYPSIDETTALVETTASYPSIDETTAVFPVETTLSYPSTCSAVESDVSSPYHYVVDDELYRDNRSNRSMNGLQTVDGLEVDASSSSSSSSSCNRVTTVQGREGNFSCAMCDQTVWVRYLSQLGDIIRRRFQEECSQLVVYSVAFGTGHENMLDSKNWYKDSKELLKQHGHCFFAFVSSHNSTMNDPEDYLNPSLLFKKKGLDGLFHLIPIPSYVLPYANQRRNTKLFKMFGGLHLFDFSKYIIWQDAKLQTKLWSLEGAKRDYEKYARQTADSVCVSVKSLPLSSTTFGANHLPSYQSHCDVLLKPNHGRVITDNSSAIQRQCATYLQNQQQRMQAFNYGNDNYQNSSVAYRPISLDDALIDSALIVWNQRRAGCRRFNFELSCRWSSEIHCHGDRDQVSFPEVIAQMGLVQRPDHGSIKLGQTEFLDKLLWQPIVEHDNSVVWEPRIHMGRSMCHWYHSRRNVLECPSNVPGIQSGRRVAIVVVGTLQRYSLNAALNNLIRPLVFEQDHAVDMFLSLSTKSAPPFRSAYEYMDHLTWDPLVYHSEKRKREKKKRKKKKQMTKQSLTPTSALASYFGRQMSLAGATPRHVHFPEDIPQWEADPIIQLERENATSTFHAVFETSLQFPIRDRRRSAKKRTDRANRNLLTVFYALKQLWNQVLETEKVLGVKYDFVLFLRDDAHFVERMDLNRLLQNSNNTSEDEDVDAYVLSCDAGAQKMHPLELNDHGGLYRRRAAEVYGTYWDTLFQDGVIEGCADRLEKGLGRKRGCNSEMLLRWILLEQQKLRLKFVGQQLLPFQRAVHVQLSDGTSRPCFHKYCQSHQDPLLSNGTLKRCLDLSFK